MKAPDSTFLRFLIAGAINTLFGFLIYSASILFDLAIWQALLVGNIAGLGFNFITTGGYAFRDLSGDRFLRFSLAYTLIYVVNLGLVIWLERWMSNAILIQGLVAIPMALGSYVLMVKLVFHRPS